MAGAVPEVLSVYLKATGGVDNDVLGCRAQILLTGDLRRTAVGVGTDPEIDVVGVCMKSISVLPHGTRVRNSDSPQPEQWSIYRKYFFR